MRASGVALIVAAGIVLALGGCRESEQDRILSYDKGIYLGKKDTGLTETQRAEMRERVQHQGGAKAFANLGGGSSGSSSVRPPEPDTRTRTMRQGDN